MDTTEILYFRRSLLRWIIAQYAAILFMIVIPNILDYLLQTARLVLMASGLFVLYYNFKLAPRVSTLHLIVVFFGSAPCLNLILFWYLWEKSERIVKGQVSPHQTSEQLACPHCGAIYTENDYSQESETWSCSSCRNPLPRNLVKRDDKRI